jgi:hypothetical protein
MSSDPELDDSLVRTLAELRRELNHLIDEQVSYLKERQEEPISARAAMPRPAPAVVAAPSPPEPPDDARARGLDPRQRLDALAKHLDHRRRQANGTGPERGERAPAPKDDES